MIDVRGRGLKVTRIAVIPHPGGVTIRVDDDANPETWIEFRCTATDLAELLLLSQDAAACAQAEERYQAAKRTIPGLEG